MKYIFTKVILSFFFVTYLSGSYVFSAENQLITEVGVLDADSTFRFLYLYNSNGKKVLETKYFKQNDTWIRKSQNEWLYDSNQCITQRERVWKNDDWLVGYTIDYDYVNGLLMTEIHNRFQNGAMTSFRKISYEYVQNAISTKSEYYWHNESWELSELSNYTYLANGKLLTSTTTTYQSNAIVVSYLSTFTYNSDGNVLTQIIQQKEGSGDWINSQFVNWYYVSTGSSLVSSLRTKEWDFDLKQWSNSQRTDYSYNSSNLVIAEINQHWEVMFWKNDSRYDYIYDGSGRQTSKLLSMPIYNEWRATVSVAYSNFSSDKANFMDSRYNFWGGTTGELTSSFIPYMFNDEVVLQKAKQITISYIPVIETVIPTNYGQQPLNLLCVYPNPSDGIYYVDAQKYDLKSWTISDLKGRLLKTHLQASLSGVIDITDLPKGIYILRAITPNALLNQKLIKK